MTLLKFPLPWPRYPRPLIEVCDLCSPECDSTRLELFKEKPVPPEILYMALCFFFKVVIDI